MRVVIDSNCLQSEELDDFLRMSSNNKAVLIDYAFIEAYKDETLVSIPRSMAVLRKYPNQVIVLHGTGKISRLSPSAKSIADRMIWMKYTKYFVSYCDALTALEKGDSLVIAQALTLGTKAQQIIDEMLNDSVEVTQLFAQFAKFFDNSQLKTIRKRLLVDDNFAALLMEIIGATAFAWTEGHPHKVQHLKSNQLPNHFIYRQAICFVLYLFDWIRGGQQMGIKTTKLRNDKIDILFAVYGTYFNGLMTKDAGLKSVHDEARVLIHYLGGVMPNPYDAIEDKRNP